MKLVIKLTRLKELRKLQNETQEQIADLIGITRAAYSNIENGKREPDFKTLLLLAQHFCTSIDYLLGRDPINAERPALQNGSEPKDSFTYAMQNECRDLTDEDKALLISMAKQLSSARKAKNGQTD